MPRPVGLPRFIRLGDRVKWWRVHRDLSRKELAKKAKMATSTLADLENGQTESNRKSHLLAAALGLNPHYMETDDGEPEAGAPQEPPPEAPRWPFPDISPNRFGKLNKIEISYAESKLIQALDEIDRERRNNRKGT